jgi:hypothetical protein
MNNLSELLNFKTNDYLIYLGMNFDKTRLQGSRYKKAGFFFRRQLGASSDEIVWWSKNCQLSYLDGGSYDIISPSYGWGVPADKMYGTSAFAVYKRGFLEKFTFQIILNRTFANGHLHILKEKLLSLIGEPSFQSLQIISWNVDMQKVTLCFPINDTGYIILEHI